MANVPTDMSAQYENKVSSNRHINTMTYTFTPTYESKEVSISEQEYAEDSRWHGETFISLSSGGLTVHYDDISIDWKDDNASIWFVSDGKNQQFLYADKQDAREIAQLFE